MRENRFLLGALLASCALPGQRLYHQTGLLDYRPIRLRAPQNHTAENLAAARAKRARRAARKA